MKILTFIEKLFIEARCPGCEKTIVPTGLINIKVPPEKRIDIHDNYLWEHFSIAEHPIVEKIDFDSYPTAYLKGILVVGGGISKSIFQSFLDGFKERDKIIQEGRVISGIDD